MFDYVEDLDAFLVTEAYRALADRLGLTEWTPVVWIGRLFTLDNDYGEHWFDNWDEREALEERAKALGIDTYDLMIVVPERFADKADGPCHSPAIRKRFWTDVLKSLELSYDLLFEEARRNQEALRTTPGLRDVAPEEFVDDLEERIAAIKDEMPKES